MTSARLLLILGFVLSAAIIITALTISYKRVSTSSRAATIISRTGQFFSANNSYIFASPITAEADGVSPIRITVFLLNNQGLGVAGKTVGLRTNPALSLNHSESVTDGYGKAIFDAVSTESGDYAIDAAVSGATIGQQLVVSFR